MAPKVARGERARRAAEQEADWRNRKVSESAPAYVDTSVLVAALSPLESAHHEADRWVRGPHHLVTSVLAEVELARAMLRRGMSLELGPDVRRLLDECELVEMDATIRVQASRLMPGSLRTLDAVHIATALVAGVAIFATLDQRQRVGAEEAGLHLVKL